MKQKVPTTQPQVELTCLGLHVKASGRLAVILVVLLVGFWMVLARVHIS